MRLHPSFANPRQSKPLQARSTRLVWLALRKALGNRGSEQELGGWPQRTSKAFSSVDPVGTWAWRRGSLAAAAVRLGAVALAMPRAEVAVQLRAVAEALHAEVVVASLRRAVAAEVASPLRAVAAMVELSLHADATEVELPMHAEPAFSREAWKRCRTSDCQHCYPWRYRCRWLFRHAVAHREAHDCGEESQCCWCRFSCGQHRDPPCPVTARREASGHEASRCWLRGRLLRPSRPVTARREAHDYPEWSRHCRDRSLHPPAQSRRRRRQ